MGRDTTDGPQSWECDCGTKPTSSDLAVVQAEWLEHRRVCPAAAIAELRGAAQVLSRTEPGRNALGLLRGFFTATGSELAEAERTAFVTLLSGSWSEFSGTTRELIREAMQDRGSRC